MPKHHHGYSEKINIQPLRLILFNVQVRAKYLYSILVGKLEAESDTNKLFNYADDMHHFPSATTTYRHRHNLIVEKFHHPF